MARLHYTKNKYEGYVTLIAVIIIMAISVSVIVTALLSSIDSSKIVSTKRDSLQARFYADTCAEIALNRLKSDSSYTGNEIIPIDTGTCRVISVVNSGTNGKIILTESSVNNSYHKIQVQISSINPVINIVSWYEIN